MNTAVQQLVEAFERLSPADQQEAATLILRSVAELENPPLDDEAIAQIADLSFQEYDAREAANDGSGSR
jgi:hypothetical protein